MPSPPISYDCSMTKDIPVIMTTASTNRIIKVSAYADDYLLLFGMMEMILHRKQLRRTLIRIFIIKFSMQELHG